MATEPNKPSKEKKKHIHDFQLLCYGNKTGYIGTTTAMMVLIVCRDCAAVFEKTVNKFEAE